MSLWRVRHNLTSPVEAALIVLALAYGIFAIYLASVRPLVVALTTDIRSVPERLSLDTDEWSRATNVGGRYVFGVPKGWVVDATSEGRVAIGRSSGAIRSGGPDVIVIETRPIGERSQVENIAAAELTGSRPALYDVAVHGRAGLFAVEFEEGRIARQTVYVQAGPRVHIFRGGSLDPAAFSAFISTVKFLPEPSIQSSEPEL